MEDNGKQEPEFKVIITDGAREDMAELGWTDDDSWAETRWERIKFFYWRMVPYNWRPSQIWYRLKCWAWFRYTTVKPRTMPWNTWTDRTDLMPHMMFELLADFIEKEKPAEHFDIEKSHHKANWEKMFEAYRWWKEVYVPAYQADEADDLEDVLVQRMHDLVDVHRHMWT